MSSNTQTANICCFASQLNLYFYAGTQFQFYFSTQAELLKGIIQMDGWTFKHF